MYMDYDLAKPMNVLHEMNNITTWHTYIIDANNNDHLSISCS